MKYLILLGMLFTQIAQAEIYRCDVERNGYSVIVDVSFENLKLNRMAYYKSGKKYKDFNGLSLEKFVLGSKSVSYDVVFNQGSYYMELDVHSSGQINGRYIPKSSLFSFEEEFSCIKLENPTF